MRRFLPLTAMGAIFLLSTTVFGDPSLRFWTEENLDTEQAQICGGYYLLPERDDSVTSFNFDRTQPIEIQSDFANLVEQGESHLYGNVIITQGGNEITAEKAFVSISPRSMRLADDVLVSSSQYAVIADAGKYDEANQSSVFKNAHLVAPELNAHARADILENVDESTLVLTDAFYTTCAPTEDGWHIEANEITLNTESGFGDAYHLLLYVQDTPVFYIPYFRFPIDDKRHSGLLYPSYSYGLQNGHALALPMYWNIAPEIDLTLTPQLIQQRGFVAESELRFLLGNHETDLGQGSISASFLPEDELYQNKQRYFFNSTYDFTRPRWDVGFDYNNVSDDDYLFDINSSIAPSRLTYLNRTFRASHLLDHGLMSLNYTRYEVLSDALNPYTQEPQLNIQYAYPFLKNFMWNSRINLGNYSLEDNVSEQVTGTRHYFETGIGYNLLRESVFVKSNLKIKYLSYNLEGGNVDEKRPSITLPQATIDTGLIFERSVNAYGLNGTQTLEPRLFMNYVPSTEQETLPNFDTSLPTFNFAQLFRDNRYAGLDRIGDNKSISAALGSRWINDSGKELLSASLGQIFYLDNREISLEGEDSQRTRSLYAFRSVIKPSDAVSGFFELTWRDFTDEWQESHAVISYHESQDFLINLGFHFIPDIQQQVQLSGVYQLNPHWQLFAETRHEFESNDNIEALAGFEWQNCCSAIRLAGSRTLEKNNNDAIMHENRVLLEFELKGLGAIGNSFENNLTQLIKGYK